MGLTRQSKRLSRKGSLEKAIIREKLNTQTTIGTQYIDSQDNELGHYVASFMDEFRKIPPLEKFDLTSPENARKAVEILNRTKADLDQKLKNARLLKGLLEQKRTQ